MCVFASHFAPGLFLRAVLLAESVFEKASPPSSLLAVVLSVSAAPSKGGGGADLLFALLTVDSSSTPTPDSHTLSSVSSLLPSTDPSQNPSPHRPSSPVIKMAAVPPRTHLDLPMPRDRTAPHFEGRASDIADFIEDFERLADKCNLTQEQKKKYSAVPFDYTKAASVMHANRGQAQQGGQREQKKVFDPYSKTGDDGLKGARKAPPVRGERSATFKK